MKRIFCVIVTSILLALASCDLANKPNPTPTPDVTTSQYEENKEVRYEYTFGMYNGIENFVSIEELYQFLSELDDEKLETIRERENRYIENTSKKLKLSEAELKNGVFGNFRKTFLESETFMFPHYIDNPLPQCDPLANEDFYMQHIQLFEFGSFTEIYRKPWINVSGEIEDEAFLFVSMTYIDPSLINEANEKGASWLLSEREPDGFNVYNYQEVNKALLERYTRMDEDPENEFTLREQERMDLQNMKVYEKTYGLGDRDVLAMVIDNPREETPVFQVYFVYDNILVCVLGRTWILEAALPHLTFREIHMPTGEPLRDTPGRTQGGE